MFDELPNQNLVMSKMSIRKRISNSFPRIRRILPARKIRVASTKQPYRTCVFH